MKSEVLIFTSGIMYQHHPRSYSNYQAGCWAKSRGSVLWLYLYKVYFLQVPTPYAADKSLEMNSPVGELQAYQLHFPCGNSEIDQSLEVIFMLFQET